MARKGNRVWGSGIALAVREAQPTQFELKAKELGLFNTEDYLASHLMREWIQQHYRARYVPETTLKAMGIDLDRDFDISSMTLSARV